MQVQQFGHTLRPRLADRAAIGLLALATDATVEIEWRGLLGQAGVEFFVARVPMVAEVNPETLMAMEHRLGDVAKTLLPDSPLDVLAYACTSASLVIGEDRVAAALRAVRPGIAVTTPLGAAKAALSALGLRRVAVLTPYVDAINLPMRQHLEESGFDIPGMGSFMNERDPEVVRIEPAAIRAAALSLGRTPGVDGVFIACTALRGAGLVKELEASLGLPVTTSNHAMAWHALRLAGVGDTLPSAGRLFQIPGIDDGS